MAYKMNEVFSDWMRGRSASEYDKEQQLWIPSRPLQFNEGSFQTRLKDAWMVFRGKAQAVIWR